MNKKITTSITLLVVIAIVFVLNYLVGGLGFGNFRWDVTEENLYTLSSGTKNILDRISPDKPVTIRYYATTDDRVLPPQLKPFCRTLEDLLLEFEKASNNKVVLEKIAPNPNTEEEDKAREDELQGQQVNNEGDQIYIGLAIQSGKTKEVLPFIHPREESQLEYNIARAISKVCATGAKVVGVMSAMPIQGSPMMPWMQQQGQQPPWAMIANLRRDYEVREVPFNTASIDSDIGVLVVVHPANITEETEYAIDQYVMKGGKVIAFVDPMSIMAQQYSNQRPNPMMGQQAPTMINQTSELKNLFKAWGVGFTDQVVADMNYRNAIFGRVNPTSITLPAEVINKDDRITSELQSLMMLGAGSFKVEKTDGVSSVILVESSENSELIDTTAAEKLRREALMSFNPSGTKKALAVRLTGKFKTAFPSGKPASPGGDTKESGGAQDDPNAPKPAATPPAASTPAASTPAPAPVAAPPAPPAPVTTPPAAEAAKAPPAPKGQSAQLSVTPAPAPPPVAAPPSAPAPAAPAAAEPKKDEAKKDDTLKESTGEPMILLFADSDMMFDGISMAQDPMGGGLMNSNMALFFNAVEVLTGGGDLLSVRSRASTTRPFKKLDEMKSKLEEEFRPQLMQLDQKLQSTAAEISTLKLKRDKKSGTFFIDPADVAKLENLQAAQVDLNKKIRELKKQQNKKIDRTETMITVANVLGMPVVVVLIGILLALRRRAATAAR
jgi:ABC-type uncharacterized transport system involved in gliding motility auxiliary subunit